MHVRFTPLGAHTRASGLRPLVCLHQSPKSGREFSDFMTCAAQDRLVIAPDYPGYGESDLPPEQPAVRIEDYARSVWQALDVLGVDEVDLFGNHTGGAVAVEMAYQKPSRVGNIAMISASILNAQEVHDFDRFFQAIELDEKGSRFIEMWRRVTHYASADMSYEMMAISFAEGLRGGEAYEWGHRAAFAYNHTFIERISQLNHPIVILNPADLLFEFTKRASPLLNNGRVLDLPNWGASVLYTHPRDVYRVLAENTF